MRIFPRFFMRSSMLIALLGVAFLAFPAIASAHTVKEADNSSSLAGTWNVTVTFIAGDPASVAPPPGTQIQAVLIFSSNGRLSGPPIPVGLPDDSPVGTWSVIHGNFFSYQFKMHEFYDAQHLQLKDTVYVNQVGILSPNGNTWSSTGAGTVFDPNGSLIEADITSSVATRAS